MTRRRRSVCLEPGCPVLTLQTRCEAHRRARAVSRQARGYDAAHEAERRRYEVLLAGGAVLTCATCPTEIRDGDKWDLGHTPDRTGYLGPQCVPCNRATARVNE